MDTNFAKGVAEYIGLTQGIMADQKVTIEKQAAELASQQKTASNGMLEKVAVEQTIDNCIEVGYLKESERTAAIEAVTTDPGQLLTFLDKLAGLAADSRKQPAPLGRPAGRTQKVAKSNPQNPPKSESDLLFEAAFKI